ncbi:AB hydrolase-1 domain-containing protein [Frankia sp. Hr75.2]|nr:AB hydrolase-1 domain-containing protein [Frankia sp. Hr75.2]
MIRLAYEIFGDGPTILLVHGGAEDAAMLAPQALALAAAAHAEIMKPIEEYTARRPGDWTGAYHRALDVLSGGTADLTDPAVIRSAVNAEAFVRDDARLITSHPFAAADLPPDRITVAVGAGTSPLHRLIADRLAEWADLPVTTVAGADDHEVYLSRPEVLATHLAERAARAGGPVS